jgi:hypothetical protein
VPLLARLLEEGGGSLLRKTHKQKFAKRQSGMDPSCPDFAVSVEAKTHFAVWVLLEEIN